MMLLTNYEYDKAIYYAQELIKKRNEYIVLKSIYDSFRCMNQTLMGLTVALTLPKAFQKELILRRFYNEFLRDYLIRRNPEEALDFRNRFIEALKRHDQDEFARQLETYQLESGDLTDLQIIQIVDHAFGTDASDSKTMAAGSANRFTFCTVI